jgi:GNAT superfamily N-acetyltransferase
MPLLARTLNRLLAPRAELCCDILYELSLANPLPDAPCALDVEIRLATAADLDLVLQAYAPDPFLFLGDLAADGSVPAEVRKLYADRLDRGELCFIGSVGGEPAHLNWTCLTWGDAVPGRPIVLRGNEAYTTDGFTYPAFRGKNVHAHVLRAMLEYARGLGRTVAYTLAGGDRPEGQKGLHKLGWREIGRVHYLLHGNGYKAAILRRVGRLDPISWRGLPAALR